MLMADTDACAQWVAQWKLKAQISHCCHWGSSLWSSKDLLFENGCLLVLAPLLRIDLFPTPNSDKSAKFLVQDEE